MRIMHLLYFLISGMLAVNVMSFHVERVQEQNGTTCDKFMHLFLILDSSASVGLTNFQQAKEILKDLASRLAIGPNQLLI